MTPARPAADAAAPPFIGLTGAVAAGKSEALAALARLGAATLESDAIVRELLGTERVRDLLVARWGEEVAPDGVVDRERVGAIVFERPDQLAWLEAVLHPLVGERVVAWRDGLTGDPPAAVVEVPLLFETGLEKIFDATISVVAPDEVRAERAAARGTTAFDERVSRQLPQSEKAARATHVVRNDGSIEDLEAELARLLPQIAGAGSAA
jgi:dephospho-CoA kinase